MIDQLAILRNDCPRRHVIEINFSPHIADSSGAQRFVSVVPTAAIASEQFPEQPTDAFERLIRSLSFGLGPFMQGEFLDF